MGRAAPLRRAGLRLLAVAAAACAAGSAHAHVLDDALAGLHSDATRIWVVPRIDHVVGPLRAARDRLARHAWLRERLRSAVADQTATLGFDPLDAAAMRRAGVRADGPLLYAESPAGPSVVVRVSAAAAAAPLGLPGPAKVRNGYLYVAPDEARLSLLLAGRAAEPERMRDCPRGRGEADAFLRLSPPPATRDAWPTALAHGCVTVRFDPDALRVDARLAPDAGPVLAGRGPRSHARRTEVALHLRPERISAVAGLVPPAFSALAKQWDGRMVVRAGAGPRAVQVWLGVANEATVAQLVGGALAQLAAARADTTVKRAGDRAWTLHLATPDRGGTERDAPDTAHVAVAGRALAISTEGPAGPAPSVPPFRLAAWLGGPPFGEAALIRRVGRLATDLGLDPGEIEQAATGLLFLFGHTDGVRIDAWSSEDGLEVRAEVGVL